MGNSPLDYIDPDGLWKVQISGTFPWGFVPGAFGLSGEVTFGRDPDTGRWFAGFGIGPGWGASAKWDPTAKDPYHFTHPSEPCPQTTTMYTGLKYAFDAKAFGLGVNGSVSSGFSANPDGEFEAKIRGDLGGPFGLGFEGEAGWNNRTGGYNDGISPTYDFRRATPLLHRTADLGFRGMALREYGFSW